MSIEIVWWRGAGGREWQAYSIDFRLCDGQLWTKVLVLILHEPAWQVVVIEAVAVVAA